MDALAFGAVDTGVTVAGWGQRVFDRMTGFFISAYGLGTLTLGNDDKRLLDCEEVIDAPKGTPANIQAIEECAKKYGELMPMFGERERRDAEAFVRQPHNLKLLLPGEADAAITRFNFMRTTVKALPTWLYYVVLAMLPIFILLSLPFLMAFFQVLANGLLLAKLSVLAVFFILILAVFFVFV